MFFCDSLHGEGFFLQRFSEVFLRRCPATRVFCDGSTVFFATVQRFSLRHFRRVKKRSGWYSVHRSGSGATYDR